MAYTTIDDPSRFFHMQLYTGNGGTNAITNNANYGDFQPDLVILRCRSTSKSVSWYDLLRGTEKRLESENNQAEDADTNGITTFGSNGFTVSSGNAENDTDETYIAYQWSNEWTGSAHATSGSGSGDGYINDLTRRHGPTGGHAFIAFQGANDEISDTEHTRLGHGLSAAPTFAIIKCRNVAYDWNIMGNSLAESATWNDRHMEFAATQRIGNTYVGTTAADTDYIYLGNDDEVNDHGKDYVGYVFHDVQGYSKFGTYEGNGDADGPFVYLGFKPAFVCLKDMEADEAWLVYDDLRDTCNKTNDGTQAQISFSATAQESASPYDQIDFLSNGFKMRFNGDGRNISGNTYCYFAFARNPLVTSGGVPALAH